MTQLTQRRCVRRKERPQTIDNSGGRPENPAKDVARTAGESRSFGSAKSVAAVLWFALCISAWAQSPGNAPQSRSLVEHPAPAFAVLTLDGKPVSLADYRGKVILVNLWATWCGNSVLECRGFPICARNTKVAD
jgi:hypothetical protein